MSGRFMRLATFVAVVALAGSASADLLAHWQLDDGAGATAVDSTGNGYNGTLMDNPEWIQGEIAGALDFDGAGDYVDFGNPPDWPAGTAPRTMAGWGRSESVSSGWSWLAAYGSPATSQAMFIGRNGSTVYGGGYGDDVSSANFWDIGEWHHVCLTYNGTVARLYGDGVELVSQAKTWDLTLSRAHLGRQVNDAAEFWNGAIDDVRLYDHALTAAEVKALIPLKPKARRPEPEDGATGVVGPLLEWSAGDTAFWHNVYLSTSPELTDADQVAGPQIFAMHWHVAGFESGVTYYWRVDEIEADGTVHTGDVWTFTTAPVKAFAPVPADEARFQMLDAVLTWTAGVDAASHDVYFGTDEAAVAGGADGTFKGNLTSTTYEPGALVEGGVYYWRVDEVARDGTKEAGDVWSFRTMPVIVVSDPNLLGWWTLDEGQGANALDWSGHGVHGVLLGNPEWAEGNVDGAIEFDGDGDFIDMGSPEDWPSGREHRSMCGWAKTDSIGAGYRWIAAYGTPGTSQAMFIGINGTGLYGGGYGGDDVVVPGFWEPDVWHHICLTYDGSIARLYADGALISSEPHDWDLILLRAHIGRQVNTAAEFWSGLVDDVRVYNKVLTLEEIQQAMRGNPLRAWALSPADKSIVDVRTATPLMWSPGDGAVGHDVYFGTDEQAVQGADASDTSGVYRGQLGTTSYTPAEGVEWGQSYAWRVDEVGADGTITAGVTWTFTVADYLIVDDFESYTNDSPNRVFQTWVDGLGYSADDHLPAGDPGNGTGALVGHDIWTPESPHYGRTIIETSVVNSGKQSMPFYFNNDNTPWYSEAVRTWQTPQDWTLNDVNTLTLYFRGGGPTFVQSDGHTLIGSTSGDIWGSADYFRYVYKRLTGDGSIVIKVNSMTPTASWAKAGVMIRQSLEPGARHVMLVVTPGNGVQFAWRELTAGASGHNTQGQLEAPHWIRLTRVGNAFTAAQSVDGVSWQPINDAANSTHEVSLMDPVYIGLAVASNNTGATCVTDFSDITTTGGVSGQWAVADIGGTIPGNDPGSMYVRVEDTAGRAHVAVAPEATLTAEWTEWSIPLSDLAAAGVNTAAVGRMTIGVGDPDGPQPDGSGLVHVDDIRVTKP